MGQKRNLPFIIRNEMVLIDLKNLTIYEIEMLDKVGNE